jgi:hypothetical protein
MATTTPVGYNTGSTISGTQQIGSLAIGTGTTVHYDLNPNGVKFWMGPDEELGYVIGAPQPPGNQPTEIPGVTGSVQFWRTVQFTEASFVSLTNYLFNQNFSTGSESNTYLNNNGYWTSWGKTSPLVNGSIYFYLDELSPPTYLVIPNSTGFAQNTAFTIECWLLPNAPGGYVWAMLQQNFLTLKYDTDNQFKIDMSYVGYPPGYVPQGRTYPVLSWYHIALSWNGTNGWLFINGVIEATFTGAGALTDAGNPLLIAQYQSIGGQLDGLISNFRVVKGTAVYTSPFTPPTSPLTAISGTQLLLNTYYGPNIYKDSSVNNFTVTPSGSVQQLTNNPFGT